ncbi:MAG: hypothetical protein KF832_22355 [Caldilineaceae bacterium]|nr:hypothetical protein [Caldilineaceae bacterium]
MHTSSRINANDFAFWRQTPTGDQPVAFAAFCPDYHPLDRIGVVSPTLEAGVHHTGYALLALTTAFYDTLRARGDDDFFDYPQHFAFVGARDAHLETRQGLLPLATPTIWHAWSWLDVWPDHKWITGPATAAAMIQQIFTYQINRIFWPANLTPDAAEVALPDYAWKMLRTRLKSVYLYPTASAFSPHPSSFATAPSLALRVTPAVEQIFQESLEHLPAPLRPATPLPAQQPYTLLPVDDFLAMLQSKTPTPTTAWAMAD